MKTKELYTAVPVGVSIEGEQDQDHVDKEKISVLGSESGFGSHVAVLVILVFFSLLTFCQYVQYTRRDMER